MNEKNSNVQIAASTKVAMGAGAAVAAAGVAQGGIVYVNDRPVTMSLNDAPGSVVTWDVDGIDGAEFEMWRRQSSGGGRSFFSSNSVQLASATYSYGALNGRGVVGPGGTDNFLNLAPGFQVGPTLAGVYDFGDDQGTYRYRNILQSFFSSTTYGSVFSGVSGGYDFDFGIDGENFIGFSFVNGAGEQFYGWAKVIIDLGNPNVTISEWAYNDTPRGSILVGQVPAPGPLAALALGAAGLLGHRGSRRSA